MFFFCFLLKILDVEFDPSISSLRIIIFCPTAIAKMSGLSTQFLDFLNKLQSQYYATPYDELVALGLWGRIQLYDWTLELVGVGIILLLVVFFTVGLQRNQQVANSFLNAIKPALEENFFQVGVKKDQFYIKDSPQNFTTYATGRVNISGITINVDLAPRQNLFFYLGGIVFSSFFESIPVPEDLVHVTITPSNDSKIANYIFAIVNKDGMNKERDANFFLSLTKTTESSTLPTEFVFMSESAELNSSLVSQDLSKILSKSGRILKFLTISDLPSEKPSSVAEAQSHPKLALSLKLSTNSNNLDSARELIEQLIELADKASTFQLKPDQQKKISNVRAAEVNKIEKAIQEQKNEELKEQKYEAEREARRNQAKLSPEAQEKLDKKMKEKKERRAKNKQIKRY